MTASSRIAGVVLAGGRSSRMDGADKAFETLADMTLTERSALRLKPQVAALAVSTNAPASRLAALGVPLLADPFPGYPGPLAGVLAGLDWAHARFDAIVTVAVDTPFFPRDLVAHLAAGATDALRVAGSEGRLHPVFALWPCRVRGALRALLESGRTGRVMTFLEEQGFEAVDFPLIRLPSGPVDPFFNVNTPGDLDRARRIAGEMDG